MSRVSGGTAVAWPQWEREAEVARARPLAGVKVKVGAARAATDGDSARGGRRSGV